MNFGKVAYRHTGICKRLASQRIKCLYLSTDAGPTAPPLLLKIKSDLKAAMKAKDTNRYLLTILEDEHYHTNV